MNKQNFNTMDNVCLNLSNKGVNFIFLLKFCKDMHYFHEEFTQPTAGNIFVRLLVMAKFKSVMRLCKSFFRGCWFLQNFPFLLRFGKSFGTNSKKLSSPIGRKKYNLVHTKSQVKRNDQKVLKAKSVNETFRSDRGKCRQKRYFLFNLWTWWWKWHVWSLSGTWLIRHFLVLPFSLSNHIYSFTLRYLTTFKGWRSFSSFIRFASVIQPARWER